MLTRLRRQDDGFALVTAIAVLAVMLILLGIVLTAGQSSFEVSERNSRFTRTLGVAEAGANDAVTMLGSAANRSILPNPCPMDDTSVPPCTSAEGEYRLDWTIMSSGAIEIVSTGYFPNEAASQVSRQIRVVLSPESTFKYALFSNSTLDIKNNQVIIGDIFANQKVTLGTNAVVCGSIINASGGVETQNGAQVVQSYSTFCSGKAGDVWAGGSINLGSTGYVQGNATASAPSGTSCPPVPNTTYQILGGSVGGTATACGAITSSASASMPNTATAPPPITALPVYTFDVNNYPDLSCYGGSPCDPANTSATAVTSFSAVPRANMSGTYAIWQTQPTKDTRIDLDGLSLSGDLTIVTNAPIDLGNTTAITSSVPANLAIISLYIPPTGTKCDTNGGDCSIYAKNAVVFDEGDPNNADDGVVGLLYTTGKMAFKNQGNEGEGALYAGSMDLKNGFEVIYNSRVERVLGFGVGLEQTLWQELAD